MHMVPNLSGGWLFIIETEDGARLDLPLRDTVDKLKDDIFDHEGTPPPDQMLFSGTREISDGELCVHLVSTWFLNLA